MFVDIVSKNGNMLLDIGPMADGTIPDLQVERLNGLGAWLDVNGDAIFGTRPWGATSGRAQADSAEIETRFTQKAGALYLTLLDTPRSNRVRLDHLRAADGTTVALLGQPGALNWGQTDGGLVVNLAQMPASPAHVLKITPAPQGG